MISGRPVLPRAALLAIFCAAELFAQLSLTVAPQQLQLAASVGSTTPVSQTVALLPSSPQVPFTTAIRYLGSAAGWLAVSPSFGTAPTNLEISAIAGDLPAGTYRGQVTITSGVAGAFVDVVFSVGPGSGGSLVADPSGLTFIGEPGISELPSQNLSVTAGKGASGPVAFTATASSSGNWLSVYSSSGTTPATLTVTAIQPPFSGIHHGAITITPMSGGLPVVVPVTLVTAGGEVPAALNLSQFALSINHQFGSGAPALQLIYVSSVGGNLQYTAATSTPWLRLETPSNPTPATTVTDTTPSQLGIVVNPAGLPPGTYIGVVTVTSAGLPPTELPVSLTVTASPSLNADPSSLAFDDITQQLFVLVTSTDASTLSFTASSPAPWLSVTPSSGSTQDGLASLTVTVLPWSLSPGTYSTTLTLTMQGTGSTLRIPVRLTVSGAAPARALIISDTSVELSGVAGGSGPSKTLIITPSDSAPHAFTAAASSTGGWLAVEPFFNTAPASVTVRANPAAADPATHEGSVTITSLVTGAQQQVPVKLTVVEQALVANPAALEFVQERGGPPPPSQTVQVTANPPASFIVNNTLSWATVSVDRGVTPASLTVSVDPAKLPAGTTSGSIQLTGPNVRLNIPVSVRMPDLPAPTVAPEIITFTHELGSPGPQPQTISVGSTGGPVRFSAAGSTESGLKWLSVTPPSGSTPATITAIVDPVLLVPGKHAGTITVASADGSAPPRSVKVDLTVTASSVAVQSLLHGATLNPTAIAPGQIVTLTGAGLGPAAGASARPTAAGAFETRLANVRVLFDGVPAPLLYVRADQINAIVPYALHGRLSARVQVEEGDSFSIPIEAKVVDAAPGLFTIASSGRGQAAALNSDLTVNSPSNPAVRDSVIVFFGTGEGQTDPPGQDGRIILTDLRRPRLTVTATIGGVPAEVLYAGSAPGIVSGVFQANLRIPQGIAPGSAPVEIQVGGETTQSGVTIAVR